MNFPAVGIERESRCTQHSTELELNSYGGEAV